MLSAAANSHKLTHHRVKIGTTGRTTAVRRSGQSRVHNSTPLELRRQLQNIPRPLNRRCRHGKELRRSSGDNIRKLALQRPKELAAACKIVFTAQEASDVASRESGRLRHCTWRQTKKAHQRHQADPVTVGTLNALITLPNRLLARSWRF